MEAQVQLQKKRKRTINLFFIKIRRDDIEEEDDLESYVRHMKKKGITVGVNNQPLPEIDEVIAYMCKLFCFLIFIF